jgi:hypothetical protein
MDKGAASDIGGRSSWHRSPSPPGYADTSSMRRPQLLGAVPIATTRYHFSSDRWPCATSARRSSATSAPCSGGRLPSCRRTRKHQMGALGPPRVCAPRLLLGLGSRSHRDLHCGGFLWRPVPGQRGGAAQLCPRKHDRRRGRCPRSLLLRIGTRLDVRACELHAYLA